MQIPTSVTSPKKILSATANALIHRDPSSAAARREQVATILSQMVASNHPSLQRRETQVSMVLEPKIDMYPATIFITCLSREREP
jgi:hypothetical protein